jgi:hypothetical protein
VSNDLKPLIEKIRSIAHVFCESQMYCWPGFNPAEDDPEEFFSQQGIEFDGILMVRYPVKRTFQPMSVKQIEKEERLVGVALPDDYKALLHEFGPVHLPGPAEIIIETPSNARELTRNYWCRNSKPLSVLAISAYHAHSDGNSIGFVREGNAFLPFVYEFDHELVRKDNDPSEWTKRIGDSLATFLLDYLVNPKRKGE